MLFMGLLEVFIRSQCDLEDPCGRPRARRRLHDAYDFIVVGGGSAGAVVAARLSEVPHFSVLLVEAGLDEPTGAQVPSMFLNFIGSSIDWGYNTEPEDGACLNSPERRCNWPRGKVLGGTSTMNGMMYMRGARADFDSWAARGNAGWSYEEVLPFFIKSEDNLQPGLVDAGYHGQGGPLSVTQFPYHPPLSHALLQAARELGQRVGDLNGARHTGFAIAQTTTRNGSRLSSARAFLRPARSRPNLHVLLNATVTRVILNGTGRRAEGVEIRRGDSGDTIVIRARNEVILSAGAVATPQLLLLSGIGPADELRGAGVAPLHHLAGVGRNLHNHVGHVLSFSIDDADTQPLNWATAMEYLLFRDGLMSGTGVSEVTGFIHSRFADPSKDHPDIQFFFGGFLANCARTGQVGERSDGMGLTGNASAGASPPPQRVVNIIPVALHPRSRGVLRLRSADPFAPPLIHARYLVHKQDVETVIDGIRFALRMAETPALRRFGFQLDRTPAKGCEDIAFGCDAYWECAIRRDTMPENHQAGSCRMGPVGDPGACVDPELRVQGLDGLRVADASVMPTVTSSNTNAPTIMIAERAADLIKQRWLRRRHSWGHSWY